jgi:hypothetical protein
MHLLIQLCSFTSGWMGKKFTSNYVQEVSSKVHSWTITYTRTEILFRSHDLLNTSELTF